MKHFGKRRHDTCAGEIFDWVSRILTILSFLGITINTICNFIYNTWSTHWRPVVVWGVVFFACVFVVRLFRNNSYLIIKTAINAFSRKSRYKILKWENTYEYLDFDKMQFRSELTVKPLETGVEYIRTRYNWSGGSAIKPEPITDDGFMTGRIESDGEEFGYRFYRVFSKVMLNGNDHPIKLGVKICNLVDVNKTASPHLLTSINVETDELVLRVILPKELHFKNVEFLEYLHATDDFHWHRYTTETKNSPVEIDRATRTDKDIISWSIKRPVFGGKYIIRWEPILSKEAA